MPLSNIRDHLVEIAVGAGALAAVSAYAYMRFSKQKKNVTRIIDTIEALKRDSVHMRDPNQVEEILSMLIKGGAAKLQVISDFDYTISRVHVNGIRCASSFGLLENGPLASEESKRKANLLYEQYYPIEMDPNMTPEEKLPYMKEWYEASMNLLAQSGLKENSIKEMVSLAEPSLREGCDVLFQSLYSHDIPLLVLSAGVGDVLKEMLKQQGLLYPNVKIIANFLQFDNQGNLIGFKGDLIQTFSKNVCAIGNQDYFDHLKDRHNVILMGDTLSDLDMAEGIRDLNCILKIGFLNSKVQENMPKFLKAYDIVLVDDQTMDVVNAFLQHVL